MRRKLLHFSLLLFYLVPFHSFCENVSPIELPWLTGPLLAPFGHIVPLGDYDIEPYLVISDTNGIYDDRWKSHRIPSFWNTNLQLPFWCGLSKKMDFYTIPRINYNRSQDAHSYRFGDLPVAIEYQLAEGERIGWRPSVKLSLTEVFPTGKYQNLSVNSKGTDATGLGSYGTFLGITFANLVRFPNKHFLTTHLFFEYGGYTPVHVKGFNIYGGDLCTRGKVHLGSSFLTILGFEYTLTQNWVLALDIQNFYSQKNRFSGRTNNPVGTTTFSDQISVAPAIEYNFSAAAGIIAGFWFSVAGHNTPDFTSGVIAFNYYGSFTKKKIEVPPRP